VVRGQGIRTEGIVLKRTNFGEADKIVTIYSKHYGKLVCLAKGIRRLTSRKRSSLEIFSRTGFFAVKGRGMEIITEAEPLDLFSSWRKDLKRVAAAYEICEMVDRLTAENVEQEEIYELLLETLKNIGCTPESQLPQVVNHFGQALLQLTGFWPKDKPLNDRLDTSAYIERIIERDLKSKRFSKSL
jgi:DNA repair protein RecO (recombination protein O)